MVTTTPTQLDYVEKLLKIIQIRDSDQEQRFILNRFHWEDYESLLKANEDKTNFSLKYLEGNLEIMAPSRNHELIKKRLGMLLECYFLTLNINFFPLGSTTFRNQALRKGIEPDECYCFETEKEVPDLAIEIIITSGGLNSLEIYQALSVSEVWFWEKEELQVYVLQADQYHLVTQSQALPQLDLTFLKTSLISTMPPLQLLQNFKVYIAKTH